MERFENLLDFINELNENGRIPYDDYSRLFDLVQEFAGAEEAINAAATDIAALLWLNGNCEYCEHEAKSALPCVSPAGRPSLQRRATQGGSLCRFRDGNAICSRR